MNQLTRVLILCTGNSARSQIAEGLLRHDGGNKFEVFSAGAKPGQVQSEAIAVMQESGLQVFASRLKIKFQRELNDALRCTCACV